MVAQHSVELHLLNLLICQEHQYSQCFNKKKKTLKFHFDVFYNSSHYQRQYNNIIVNYL